MGFKSFIITLTFIAYGLNDACLVFTKDDACFVCTRAFCLYEVDQFDSFKRPFGLGHHKASGCR
jgi:hypothetical protein